MSRFQELSRAVAKYTREGIKYRHRSIDAMVKILVGFVQYLEAPPEVVRYFPYGEYDDKKTYSAQGAVKPNDDGWWDSGLALVLGGTQFGFRFRLRTDVDKFQVRVGDSEKLHEFASPTPEALAPVWEEAFARATVYLQTGLQRFLDATRPEQSNKIGFV